MTLLLAPLPHFSAASWHVPPPHSLAGCMRRPKHTHTAKADAFTHFLSMMIDY